MNILRCRLLAPFPTCAKATQSDLLFTFCRSVKTKRDLCSSCIIKTDRDRLTSISFIFKRTFANGRQSVRVPDRFKKKKLPFETDTTVKGETLLFSCHQMKRRTLLVSFVGLFIFIVLIQSADLIYRFLARVPPKERSESPWYYWWMKIDYSSNKFKYGLMSILLLVAFCALGFSILYPSRVVREIKLIKGGEKILLNTYAPFGMEWTSEVAVKDISAVWGPKQAAEILPVRVKGKKFFYQLYMKDGTVHNRALFDETVARARF